MNNEQLKNSIASEMGRKGWGQKQLAIKAGTTQATISRILSGRLEPKCSTLRGIAIALGVSSDSLLGIAKD